VARMFSLSMNPGDFHVVETTSADIETIRQIHCDAFGYDKEARLTEQLLGDPTAEPRVSLLAFHSRKPVCLPAPVSGARMNRA
jgi:putative acetyltransferase